jgi:3-dehydroquinate synthetase
VLVDTATLATLPANQYRAGLAEVVKYGMALDADFFQYLEANAAAVIDHQGDILARIIARCCQLKADIVEKDEREQTGLRSDLNFGHTFGHALETVTGYSTLLHGEAVAIGMVCATRLAERLDRVEASLRDRLVALLRAFGLPTGVPQLDVRQILDAVARDKKTEQGKLRFVLPSRLGRAELVSDINPADIHAALKAS